MAEQTTVDDRVAHVDAIVKDPRRSGLVSLVESAMCFERETEFNPSTATVNGLVDDYLSEQIRAEQRTRTTLLGRITPRERQVVELLLAGKSTNEISKTCGLTVSTINTYMKRIFSKLDVHSRIELVALVDGRKT